MCLFCHKHGPVTCLFTTLTEHGVNVLDIKKYCHYFAVTENSKEHYRPVT